MPPPGYRAAILAALPATRLDLPELAHTTVSTVQRWLKILHDAGEIHIGGWKRSVGRGAIQPIWYAGQGTDKRCTLKRLTDQQTSARYRRSIEGTEKGDIRKAKRQASYYRVKAAKMGDPMLNALFGLQPTKKEGV